MGEKEVLQVKCSTRPLTSQIEGALTEKPYLTKQNVEDRSRGKSSYKGAAKNSKLGTGTGERRSRRIWRG